MNEFQKMYKEQVRSLLKEEHDLQNVHQIPSITKVVLNTSVGSASDIKAALEEAKRDMRLITGQAPAETRAKTSISNFKLREGMPIGCKVTLRGVRMWEFLQRLILTALPRVRDFRGVSPRGFDGNGNYTLGITDHTVFPEIELDKVTRNLGFDLTFVTNVRSDKQARALLEALGIPFSDKLKEAENAQSNNAAA